MNKPIITGPDILHRIAGAQQRFSNQSFAMRVPVDPTDIDIVLHDAAIEIQRLRAALHETDVCAARWVKLAGDVGGEFAQIVDSISVKKTSEVHSTPIALDATVQYENVPIRQITLRWLDPDGKRTTLESMVDAQLNELANEQQEASE